MQDRVHLTGPRPARQPLRRLPGPGEAEEVAAGAVPARPVPGGQRGRLIEKEQCRPCARRHRVAPDALEVQNAADPRLRPPAADTELTARPVQASTIAHHQATGRVHDDLTSRQHPVLQRHDPILCHGRPAPLTSKAGRLGLSVTRCRPGAGGWPPVPDHALRATPAHRAAGLAASCSLAGRHFDAWTIPGSTSSSPSKNLATAGRSRKVTFSAIILLRPSAILAIDAASM